MCGKRLLLPSRHARGTFSIGACSSVAELGTLNSCIARVRVPSGSL